MSGATRERFEQWLQDSGRWDSCDYGRTEIEDLFEAWQAATADMDDLLRALMKIVEEVERRYCTICTGEKGHGPGCPIGRMRAVLARYGKS